jgi:predicted permease
MTGVLEVVLPVFALVLAGFLAARRGMVSTEGFAGLTSFVFVLASPALLFAGGTRPYEGGAGPALAQVGAAVMMYALAFLLARRAFGVSAAEAALFALASVFGNSVMMGIPIILAAYGQDGVPPMLGILAIQTVTLLGLATVMTELGLNATAPWRRLLRSTAAGVLRNPVVLAVAAALLWRGLGWPVPDVLRRLLELVGGAAPPVALFCLGGGLAGLGAAGLWRETLAIALLKLGLLPLLTFALAHLLGLSPIETAVAVTIGALPTGATAFVLARRYATGADRSGAAVLVTTALSVLTLSALIGWFRQTL